MRLNIREYQSSDEAAVLRLWQDVISNGSPHSEPCAKIRRKAAEQDGLFRIATIDEEVVGTVMAGYDGVRGWIYALAVSPVCQRQGIGRALLLVAEQLLLDRGCVKVNLQVIKPAAADLICFYERAGFAIEPRLSFGKVLR